jgi:hypothetical protein
LGGWWGQVLGDPSTDVHARLRVVYYATLVFLQTSCPQGSMSLRSTRVAFILSVLKLGSLFFSPFFFYISPQHTRLRFSLFSICLFLSLPLTPSERKQNGVMSIFPVAQRLMPPPLNPPNPFLMTLPSGFTIPSRKVRKIRKQPRISHGDMDMGVVVGKKEDACQKV